MALPWRSLAVYRLTWEDQNWVAKRLDMVRLFDIAQSLFAVFFIGVIDHRYQISLTDGFGEPEEKTETRRMASPPTGQPITVRRAGDKVRFGFPDRGIRDQGAPLRQFGRLRRRPQGPRRSRNR